MIPNVTTTYRDPEDGTVIERDVPEGDLFAVGEFFLPYQIPLKTPMGIIPLPVRVHLRGAQSAAHAFENLQTLFDANAPRDAAAAQKRWEDEQRRASLADAGRGMPALRPDGR